GRARTENRPGAAAKHALLRRSRTLGDESKLLRHVAEVLRTIAPSKSPISGLSTCASATAPAFASFRDIASARRSTADECGHSTAPPGTKPPFSKRTNGNAK